MFHAKTTNLSGELIMLSMTNFLENIETVYFCNILVTLKNQWNLNFLSIELVLFTSFLSKFLGEYFSPHLLTFQPHKIIFLSSLCQIFFSVLGSFSRNIEEIAGAKFLLGIFNEATSMLMIFLFWNNLKQKFHSLGSAMIFQIWQILMKMCVFVMMLIYETAQSNWSFLWFANSFTMSTILSIPTLKKKTCLVEGNSLELESEETLPINQRSFILTGILLAFIEVLSKWILISLPFLEETNISRKIQIITLISGEFIGLVLLIFFILCKKQKTDENNGKYLICASIFLILVLGLGTIFHWKESAFLLLIRINLAFIRYLTFEKLIDGIASLKKLRNLIILVNLPQGVLIFVLFQTFSFGCFFSWIGISVVIALISYPVNTIRQTRTKNFSELELSFLNKRGF